MDASVITVVDAAPVIEPAEDILDLLTLAIEGCIVLDGHPSVGLRRDAGGVAALGQDVMESIGIIASVSEQRPGSGEGIDHQMIGLSALSGKLGEDAVEHTQATPANKPVVDRLVQAATGRSITPAQPVQITKIIPLTILRSSTRGMPYDSENSAPFCVPAPHWTPTSPTSAAPLQCRCCNRTRAKHKSSHPRQRKRFNEFRA